MASALRQGDVSLLPLPSVQDVSGHPPHPLKTPSSNQPAHLLLQQYMVISFSLFPQQSPLTLALPYLLFLYFLISAFCLLSSVFCLRFPQLSCYIHLYFLHPFPQESCISSPSLQQPTLGH